MNNRINRISVFRRKRLPGLRMLAGLMLATGPAWMTAAADEGDHARMRTTLQPLTIDTLPTSATWHLEAPAGSERFGESVASAGDVNGDGYKDVIIGAIASEQVFVYYGSSTGPSSSPDCIYAPIRAQDFGGSVACAGDVNGDGFDDIIVGATFFDDGAEDNEGAAFVFLGSAAGLSESPAWSAEGNQVEPFFGCSVASAGDVNDDGYDDVIVGADRHDNGQKDEGRTYLYLGSADGLADSPAWSAEGNQENAWFGNCVAPAGDINQDGHDDVLIGAFGMAGGGTVFLYHGTPTGLSQEPAWRPDSLMNARTFGHSVALAGDVNHDGHGDVIVSDPMFVNPQPDPLEDQDPGRVFIYHGSANGLETTATTSLAINDEFRGGFEPFYGGSVAAAGDLNRDGYDDVIIGAHQYCSGFAFVGKVFVHFGSATGVTSTPAWWTVGTQEWELRGLSVAAAGDVDNDGSNEIIIGSPGRDQYNRGLSSTFEPFVDLYRGSRPPSTRVENWSAYQ